MAPIHDSTKYEYIITHVFFPAHLPERSHCTPNNDLSLLDTVRTAARAYSSYLHGPPALQWFHITTMLDNLRSSVKSGLLDRDLVVSQLHEMETGDILVFFVRPQNTAVIIRKQDGRTLFESFKVSPSEDAVKSSGGPLITSYPESAVEIPNELLGDVGFLLEIASCLSRTGIIESNPPLHPQCMPPAILQRVGRTTRVYRITKRVRDEAVRLYGSSQFENVSRRSSLWLLVRVSIQTSFDRSPVGRASYKQFMLLFMCSLTNVEECANLSDVLLHLIASKILRRLSKLGTTVPEWLSQMAFKTCASLHNILDARRKQLSSRDLPFRNPSEDELIKDSKPLLLNADAYILRALTNLQKEPDSSPFYPIHRRRGTIQDYLSSNGSFFEDAYEYDPIIALYEVERAVEYGIDDWVACVTIVDDACAQIELLMDKYLGYKRPIYEKGEGHSLTLLTAIEFFVAVDKLAVKEIPMLVDYSPEIPIGSLERLLLRKSENLHRLARAYQYLSMRHSQSRPGWSVLSDTFTPDSLPVRYYDESPTLQDLRACIEADTAPLPDSPLLAKVVVFELQCPTCIRVWRSAIPRILHYVYPLRSLPEEQDKNLLIQVPELKRYFVGHDGPPLRVQMHCSYFCPPGLHSPSNPTLHYALQYSEGLLDEAPLKVWQPRYYNNSDFSYYLDSELEIHFNCPSCGDLEKYVSYTSHTPNDVITAQANCPATFSFEEFVVFAQLRSGGSLQWFNILHGLRTRTLNFRRHEVHYLLVHAAFQVGPLDLNTGLWVWHQELQDLSFCNVLLDMLASLFSEAADGSIDGMVMSTISLLLTRVLASSPNEHITNQAISLLRNVRRKTFSWVEELSYNLAMAPTSEERTGLLLDMAAVCRSTFDVDQAILPELLHSAEDIDALLSCAFYIHALRPSGWIDDTYLRLLVQRDRRISLTAEEFLKDTILVDPSQYGIDLAVRKMFGRYQPGTQRWEQLQYPDDHWLTCTTNVTMDPSLHVAHLDMLDGELRVNGQPLGGLPREIRDIPECQQVFRDQGFIVIPSDLPGMDFTTHAIERKFRVHYSLRDDILVLRVQFNGTRDILELIPSYLFWKDLPTPLIDGHVHWLNLSSMIIEIRPLERLWEPSSDNWRIDCRSGEYRIYKGHEMLVDVRSPTWVMVSKYFECLNGVQGLPSKSKNLLITTLPFDSESGSKSVPVLRQLSVALPHYNLSFFVNAQGEIESDDFKDMVYDENQCIGTLFGLENLLVLRPKTILGGTPAPEIPIPRLVLIPSALPKQGDNHRVQLRAREYVDDDPLDMFCHVYEVDTELGCLKGDNSVKSVRHLIRLHDATSRTLPDPLTGKTGAQEALRLLQSGHSRSIQNLRDLGANISQHPHIRAEYAKIRHRHYEQKFMDDNMEDVDVAANVTRSMQRATHLFPFASTPPQLPEYDDQDNKDKCPVIFDGHMSWPMSLDQLFSIRPAPELPTRVPLPRVMQKSLSNEILELKMLFSSLSASRSKSAPPFQQEYIARLEASAQHAREDRHRVAYSITGEDRIRKLQEHYTQCKSNYSDALGTLQKSLGPTGNRLEQVLRDFGQWPPITGGSLLSCLASASAIQIPLYWKRCLTQLALLLLDLQQSRRLVRLALYSLEEEFLKELESEPCDGWNSEEYPDWLLIQIQGNFLIRRAQAETAMEMMHPQSGENSLMQFNIGEGKSSVIIPIIAAALADGKQLIRVIVPKALTLQMFDSLVARLGGLANRPIIHLPFFRTSEGSNRADHLHQLVSQCIVEHGILLVEAEHAVSLKLTVVEEQISEGKLGDDRLPKDFYNLKDIAVLHPLRLMLTENNFAGHVLRWLRDRFRKMEFRQVDHNKDAHGSPKWLSLQKLLDSHARDILDESDEILHARFQLTYTIGLEKHIDGYPGRWIIIQQVLALVKERAQTLSKNHRNLMEYELGPLGSFPRVHIAQGSDIGRQLISLIVEDIMDGRLPGFNFRNISAVLHDAIRAFISDEVVFQLPHTVYLVEDYAKGSQENHLWSGLLLLRGLLASNVLLFALSEWRWRVNYGLPVRDRHAKTSTMFAVPYRAKDTPAPNIQFGHPDTAIILTCLSYYYAGLTQDQLRASFEILLDEDDPPTQYSTWVKDYGHESLPESLQNLRDINLRSSEQWDKVTFPLFARNQATIDFYLSRVVFPKEAKEFPFKLSGSSWDLAENREKLITGFSGTNDGRWLLPMSIAQRDLERQKGTNARVLAYLLRPENDFYRVMHEGDDRWNTVQLLQVVAKERPRLRVLLDVGAQILDLSNQQVAREWLNTDRDTFGAIYFDENNELMVLTRGGATLPIVMSPLSQQLERCVVYLDHAHTRGTDLKLPINSRAAVTLGIKATKDSLVQGCMRMRKLGRGHSVMFFAPLEVDRSIRVVTGKKDPNVRITTVDVLCWAIHETWNDIQRRAPYWAQQGMNHKIRHEAWTRFCRGDLTREELSDAWLQPEQKLLAHLYAPSEIEALPSALDPGISQRCKTLGVLSLPSAQLEEEQEREVNREREREREVELPPDAEPAEHSLHPDVIRFVKTGVLPPLYSGDNFLPVFATLKKSTATTPDADVWSPFILATADFCRTIEPESTRGTIDQYLRPVQWILSRRTDNRDGRMVFVLLSPFEVDRLLPDIRVSEHVHVHLYAPRMSERMKPFDDLRLYTIPPLPSNWTPPWSLIDQLNVFAGQLYLRDYQTYLRVCRFLGVPTNESAKEGEIRWNLFNVPGGFEENEIRFSSSPLPFVMALLSIRTKGRPFSHTHMGKMLQGQVLKERDFEKLPSVQG